MCPSNCTAMGMGSGWSPSAAVHARLVMSRRTTWLAKVRLALGNKVLIVFLSFAQQNVCPQTSCFGQGPL